MTVFNNGRTSIHFPLKVADDMDSRLKRSGMTNNILLCQAIEILRTLCVLRMTGGWFTCDVRHWNVILNKVKDLVGNATALTHRL